MNNSILNDLHKIENLPTVVPADTSYLLHPPIQKLIRFKVPTNKLVGLDKPTTKTPNGTYVCYSKQFSFH